MTISTGLFESCLCRPADYELIKLFGNAFISHCPMSRIENEEVGAPWSIPLSADWMDGIPSEILIRVLLSN